MNIMLFLGSGVSFDSGLPNAGEMTRALLWDERHSHTDGLYYPGPEPNPVFQEDNWVLRLQPFLSLLKSYADSYLSARGQREANYEDLYYMARQLADEELGEIDNPAIHMFASRIKKQCKKICCRMWGHEVTYGNLLDRACEFIQCVVHHKLFTKESPKGFDVIRSLAECGQIEKLDILTLNHDLLVETLLRQSDIKYADGFGPPSGDVRFFEPSTFDSDVKVRLAKLHGSIDWFNIRLRGGSPSTDRYCLVLKPDAWHSRDEQGNHITNLSGKPVFLVGTYNKIMSHGFGIFSEMHYRFHQFLGSHDTIVMSGYGWNDSGINGRLMNWLYSSENKRLYLFHREPENMASIRRVGALRQVNPRKKVA